jgi:hypothetical protein
MLYDIYSKTNIMKKIIRLTEDDLTRIVRRVISEQMVKEEDLTVRDSNTKLKTMPTINFKPIGADRIPAMLTPGEFIMSRDAVSRIGLDNLNAMNRGEQAAGSVYNYSVSVNVATNANSNEIARTVIAQIKQIDSQRIRGVGLKA